jgi:hypothetical protein
MLSSLLSAQLQRSVAVDFFRPLTRASTPVYVDCADRLITEAGEAGRLPHKEALELVREVLQLHPMALLADDEGAALRDVRQRAGSLYSRLLAAGWIEEQTLGLHERWTVISPMLRPLMRMLRDLAEDRAAELKTFADTLRGLCETLENGQVLDPHLRSADEMRSAVTDLNLRLDTAIEQLHAVEKLVSNYEQRQRLTETAADTLELLYGEFSQGQHMVCYDALRRGGLLSRMEVARLGIAERRDDPWTRERLAEGLQLHYGYTAAEGQEVALHLLNQLERGMAGIKRRADAIDLRMAAFNRLSQQRYRYQTELRGRRPEIVRQYCERVNARHAGARFSEFSSSAADFTPLVPELRFYYGITSLYKPRRTKAPADLSFSDERHSSQSEEEVLSAWKERQRLALTPQRAAKLLARLAPTPGQEVHSEEIRLQTVDDLLDLLALVAYETAQLSGKRIRWSVDGLRRQHGLEPQRLPADEHLGHKLERFSLRREL